MEEDKYMLIHDCYADITEEGASEEQIQYIADNLPDDIKHLANRWDWCDTEVRDKVYRWVEQTILEIGRV